MIEGGIATNVVPDRADGRAQLPLRARPLARGGRGAAARADRRPRRDRGHLELPERRRCRSATRTSSACRPSCRPRPSRRGRRSRSSGGRAWTRSTSGPGEPAQAHRRDESRADRRPRARLPRAGGVRRVKLSPTLAGLRTYPFVRLTEAKKRLDGRGRGLRRLRDGRAARGDAGLHPRGARGRDRAALDLPLGRRPARAARGDRRLGAAALRHRARPRPRDRPDARLQGGDLPPRAGRRRRADRHPDARLPRLRARRRVRRHASCSSCR